MALELTIHYDYYDVMSQLSNKSYKELECIDFSGYEASLLNDHDRAKLEDCLKEILEDK